MRSTRCVSWLILAALTSATATAKAEVRCDIFRIHARLLPTEELEIALETDLPDSTVVMVSVGRSYWEKGSSEEYARYWVSERSSVGDWRSKRSLDVSSESWSQNLRKFQKEMARATLGFDVAKISEEIHISFTVPIMQPDSRFGKGNRFLVGEAVAEEGPRVVEGEKRIKHPHASKRQTGDSEYGDPWKLKVGSSYQLSDRTPIVPERHPADPLGAIQRTKYVAVGGTIRVLKVDRSERGQPWYRVEGLDASGRYVARGWVNSLALQGQDLKVR